MPGRLRLAATISAILATGGVPIAAIAAQPSDDLPEIIVTATRRAEDIQDIPLNIAAIGGERLEQQGIADLATLGRNVPGLYVVDQGKRTSNRIVVRGLNATSVGSPEGIGNNGGETVSTYVGEIPLYLDLRLEDMDRVEVLIGPQGTLYGSSTLGGAIRYIPNRPMFDQSEIKLRGSGYSLAESDDIGARGGFTVNLPMGDMYAFRASLDYVDDPGFIDNPFLVRQGGVSDPDPDFSNPADVAANLRSQKDADYEKTWSGRVAVRARPEPGIDVNFTHYFQEMEVGGRSINSSDAFGTGLYESAMRYPEPNNRRNRLTALEITADLGFATLTSATGYSKYDEVGQRDQTDFLIGLEYSYEAFPLFSAFTREVQEDRTTNQELRLVSNSDSKLTWIGGLFYNKLDRFQDTREFTPHYPEYLGITVPDDMEYIAQQYDDLVEKALYGELTYHITDKWQVTTGLRYYDYTYNVDSGNGFPIADIDLELTRVSQTNNGTLFKFNTSYQLADDIMTYLTVSEGYRIGSGNGLDPCDGTQGSGQTVCAQPDEIEYKPDSTVNYEVGVRSQWFDRRLTLNGSIFFVDWEDPQLAAATLIGAVPITKNGKGAESKGVELSFDARLTNALTVRGSYSYVQAELSADAPALLTTYNPPGFGLSYVDGLSGDRLPGSPEEQATFGATYELSLSNDWSLALNYGLAAIGNVYTKTGLRAGGEQLGGYTVHSAGATLDGGVWSLSLYAQNLTNKFAVTGLRGTRLTLQEVSDENGELIPVRLYYHDVLRPREVGLRFTYDFEL